MSHYNASRRLFLRHAGAMTSLLGPMAAPLALNLAAIGTASAQAAPDYKALVCLFLFGGNDCAEHGAAYRCRVVGQLQRGAQPGAGFDCAACAGHAAQPGRGCRFAGTAGRGAADRARQSAGPQLRAASGDGQPADDVQHRQAAGHRAQHRPAGPAHHQGAVRTVCASQAGEPVLAQRPAEHLAGAGARRRHARLGRAHGRPAGIAERAAGVHRGLGCRQCGLAGG